MTACWTPAMDGGALVATSPIGTAWLGIDAGGGGGAARRDTRIAELDRNIARVRDLLATESFVAKAPREVVDRERQRLGDLEQEREQLIGR